MIAHYRGHQDIVQMIEAKLSFIQLQNKTEDYDLGLKKAKEEIDKRDREPKPSTPNPAGKLPDKPEPLSPNLAEKMLTNQNH